MALDLLGDRWTLLIIRDLMLFGRNTFKDFLKAGEGIATNVLSDRLRRLEAHEIIAKGRDPADARRGRYSLTRKGADLAPVLVDLIVWSARHGRTAATPQQVRRLTDDRARVIEEIRNRWAEAGTE